MTSWIKNATIYHIFIDRFAGFSAHANDKVAEFCGGNIPGIINKLDYLISLGINTLWISPFYETTAYHGYHITNFDAIDKQFGSIDELKELIKRCKEKHIRIIVDVVPNHCSVKHPWFLSAGKEASSIYRDWFYFTKWPNKYLRFLEFDELAKINLENPATAHYMINSLLKWASLGFDGFRIDHVIGIPDSFLIELSKKIKSINPDFVLIGEAWADGMRYKYLKTLRIKDRHKLWKNGFEQYQIQKHYEGIIDGVLDFKWRNIIMNNLNLISTNPSKLNKLLDEHNKSFDRNFMLPKFLDNHDTNRLMFECRNNNKLFKNTLSLLFAEEHPIIIFYGTEFGLSHKMPIKPDIANSDTYVRQKTPWQTIPEYFDFLANGLKMKIEK